MGVGVVDHSDSLACLKLVERRCEAVERDFRPFTAMEPVFSSLIGDLNVLFTGFDCQNYTLHRRRMCYGLLGKEDRANDCKGEPDFKHAISSHGYTSQAKGRN